MVFEAFLWAELDTWFIQKPDYWFFSDRFYLEKWRRLDMKLLIK